MFETDTDKLVKLLSNYELVKSNGIKSSPRTIVITINENQYKINVEFGEVVLKIDKKTLFKSDYLIVEQGLADSIIDAIVKNEAK